MKNKLKIGSRCGELSFDNDETAEQTIVVNKQFFAYLYMLLLVELHKEKIHAMDVAHRKVLGLVGSVKEGAPEQKVKQRFTNQCMEHMKLLGVTNEVHDLLEFVIFSEEMAEQLAMFIELQELTQQAKADIVVIVEGTNELPQSPFGNPSPNPELN